MKHCVAISGLGWKSLSTCMLTLLIITKIPSTCSVSSSSGPKELIQRIVLHMQVSVLHASSLSQVSPVNLLFIVGAQVVTSSLFDQWGLEGFHSHVAEVEDFYRKRRDLMVAAADKHLAGLVEYNVPLGGMFLWMKVSNHQHSFPSIAKPHIFSRFVKY